MANNPTNPVTGINISMAQIESVAVRQRGSMDFEAYYCNLCALQNSCPLPAVKAHLQEKVLDLNADRIRATDWNPILGTLKINKTLEYVAIRSYYQQTVEEQEKRGYTVKRKIPAIRSKEITYRLCKVLKECLAVSSSMKCIELQGLPLRIRDLAALAKGLMANRSLRQLSLDYSRIGDEGLEILCKGIKNAPALSSLNFTGCSLSGKGAEHLAKLVKHQAMKRHNEAWQDSLRYRRPELDRMDGIRRLSVNRNPMLADEGAKCLAEALKDDLWLKALDLQHCGLTDVGSKYLLDVLKYNTCLVVLDVRNNPMIGQELVRNMMEHLMINSNGQDTEYKWIKSDQLQDPTKIKQKKKRTKTLQSSFGRKTTIKVGNNAARKRTKSAGTPSRTMAPIVEGATTPGIPWRTALRANRYKGYPPDDSPNKYESFNGSPGDYRPDAKFKIDYSYEDDDGTEDTTKALGAGSDTDTDVTDPRGVRVEIERLRRRVKDETKARAKAEERVIELTVENNRLKQQIDDYRAKQSILDDDRVLESLEQSFQQFHSFLDLLRDAGLGQLITLAGIDQNSMPFSKGTPAHQSRSALKSQLSNGHVNSQKPRVSKSAHVHIQEPGYHQSAPDLSHQDHVSHTSRPVKPGYKSTSDTALNRDNKAVFPQIKPQNYQNTQDPTMQAPSLVSGGPNGKPKSKFDELYQKVLEETEGALSESLTKADDGKVNGGLYNRGNMGSGVPLSKGDRHRGSGDNHSEISEHSHRSGDSAAAKPMRIEDLHNIDKLPTTTDPTTQIPRGGGVEFLTPREVENTANTAKYSETFEKDDDDDVSEIDEDI